MQPWQRPSTGVAVESCTDASHSGEPLTRWPTLPQSVQILESSPRVRLVVFDSITFHFRQGVVDAGQRARVLAQMAQTLASLADKHDVAMVLINQVTTRPGAQGAPSRLVTGHAALFERL